MIIALDTTVGSTGSNQYTIFAKGTGMSIAEVQKYMGDTLGGFNKTDDVLSISGAATALAATAPAATPVAASIGFESKTVYLDGEGNTIAFVDPYYPTRPQVATITSGIPDPLVFFYPAQTGGNHKIFGDTTNAEYYATVFPTYEKLVAVTTATIAIPTQIDNPVDWSFSDFIWVAKDTTKISEQSGGSASSGFEQSGGAVRQLNRLCRSDPVV